MITFKMFFIFLLLLNSFVTDAKISDKRLCVNADCTEPVSIAKTLLKYNSPEHGVLSFQQNIDVKIFSKSAGTEADLWGVEINGKRGYAPKSMLRETKILNVPKLLVPTEPQYNKNISTEKITDKNTNENLIETNTKDQINPKPVAAAYEIIDGTTILLNPGETSSEPSPSIETITKPIEQSQTTPESTTVVPTPDPKIQNKAEEPAIKNQQQTIQDNIIHKETNHIKIENVSDDLKNFEAEIENDDEEEDDDDDEDIDAEDDEDIPDVSEGTIQKNTEKNDEQSQNEKTEKVESKITPDSIDTPKLELNNLDEQLNKQQTKDTLNKINEVQIEEIKEKGTEQKSVNSIEEPLLLPLQAEYSDKKPENTTETENLMDKVKENIIITQQKESVVSSEIKETSKTPEVPENKETLPETQFTTESSFVADIPLPILAEFFTETPENVEPISQPSTDAVTPVVTSSNKDAEKIDPISQPLTEAVTPVITSFNEATEKVDPISLPSTEAVTPIATNFNEAVEKVEDPISQPLTEATEKVQDPITQPLTELVTENTPTLEEPVKDSNPYQKVEEINPYYQKEEPEISNKEQKTDEPGLFSQIYSGLFGKEGNLSEFETKDANTEVKLDKTDEILNSNDEKEQKIEVMSDAITLETKIEEVVINNVEEVKLDQILPPPVVQKEEISSPGEEIKNVDPFEKHTHEKPFDKYLKNENVPSVPEMETCEKEDCASEEKYEPLISNMENWATLEFSESTYSTLLYLSLTAVTVLLFCLGHYYIEKRRIDSNLISNINTLEKKLLVTSKESLILQDELKLTKERLSSIEDSSFGSDEMVTALKIELEDAKNNRIELEEQITNLEKELENATEAGLELNRMLADFLSAQNGNESIMENVEHLQKQLYEQQATIGNMNTSLNTKNMDNELLQTELSVANNKIEELQAELDKMVVNLLSVQEEKSKTEAELEEQTKLLREEFEEKIKLINSELKTIKEDNNKLKIKSVELQRSLELKNNEYTVLKESMNELKIVNTNKESLAALLDVSKIKAEVQQLREEKHALTEKLQTEKDSKLVSEKQIQVVMQEMQILKDKYYEADREKVEATTRLDVLSTYFNERETQLQKELNERETLWVQKQGEATSTVERIKYIQEELQNYKSQNELLKKEILDQEVSLKSQISVLEKKSHDNWVLARQSERKLEEAKQESSQLRNRLTLVEKNLNNSTLDESKLQNRVMQPIDSNGDIAVSPLHMSGVEPPGSPPLLYQPRDHMTTSPPIPGLPFMPPPPPGVPFMPPPPGVPPFMPPLPGMFPGDHRPPPLGRMSSPPIHGRYSPDSRAYSPYERDDSPPMSPSYADSDYRRGRSPPPSHGPRTFSPYSASRSQWDDMRDYRDRPHQRNLKPRSHKGTGLSSGSGNSNESLDNSGRHSGRV